jgi:hypothetical protein
VVYSGHRWRPYLVSLDSSLWNIFKGTGGVVIEANVSWGSFYFFFSLLSPTYLLFFKWCRYSK